MVGTSNPEPLQHEKGWQRNSVGRLFRFIIIIIIIIIIITIIIIVIVITIIIIMVIVMLMTKNNDDDFQPQVWLRASGCWGSRTSC